MQATCPLMTQRRIDRARGNAKINLDWSGELQ